MVEINYVFSIGHRCNCTNFIKKNNLRKISGPFDNMFIDLETCFDNIKNNFLNFLSNMLLINKNENKLVKYYFDTTTNIDNTINNKINKLDKLNKITYMKDNYNGKNLLVNTNYIDNIYRNLYYWNKICVFLHHELNNENTYNIIKRRCKRFKKIYELYNNKTLLIHITKIIEINNIKNYINDVFVLKKKYNINCYLIIIVCSSMLTEDIIFENNILFIIKHVESYDYQFNNYKTDNNYDFDEEYKTIKKYFEFNLKTYDEIISLS